MKFAKRSIPAIILCTWLVGCDVSSPPAADTPDRSANSAEGNAGLSPGLADAIYFGGDILTMVGDSPSYAEMVAIRDGRIVYVGGRAGAEGLVGPDTRQINLDGRTLLPGFIDAHGHAWNTGVQALTANLLPPPDGDGRDIEALLRLTREWAAENSAAISGTGWIIGFGYDDAQLVDGRHPTADDLDRVSETVPVLFLHQSTHLGVMNHKGLEVAGYTAESPNPAGGVIRRHPGSQLPDGVLEEMALFIPLFSMLANFDQETNLAIARAGLAAYASHGFTTAQEGRATKSVAEAWRTLGDRGELILDVDVYPDIRDEAAYLKAMSTSKTYENGFRIAGAKLSLDGAIQNFTGWLTEPYHQAPPGQTENYNGYPAFDDSEEVDRLVQLSYEQQWQLIAHSNGDASGDQLISAVRSAIEKSGPGDRRTVMIHAQTVREDQLDEMQSLSILPSFFAMHTYYWGDLHRDTTLGRERAWRISPARSALTRGMRFTQHHDAPVALPSALAVLSAAVNRTSRSGDVIGPDQRISVYDGLRAITTWAAYQGFQEKHKGSLETGKLADFVVLDQNPLKVEPEALRGLHVVETIKEGETIYKADDNNVKMATLVGTALYRERIALPNGAQLEVTLQDVSRADAAAEVIGQVQLDAASGPPYRFEIPYNPERIDPRHRYAVRASIQLHGRLMFTTDTHYPVLTHDAPDSVEVVLRRVDTRPGASLENTYWKVLSILGDEVLVVEQQREPHLILHPDDRRVTGHGGCNSLLSRYEIRDDQIRFEPFAGTMMACPDGMDQEESMLQALGKVVRWRVSGERAQLLDEQDTVVLSLESRYLR